MPFVLNNAFAIIVGIISIIGLLLLGVVVIDSTDCRFAKSREAVPKTIA